MRVRVHIRGVVQGVGFRPFVHFLASRLSLGGFVGNDAKGVFCEVEGAPAAVARFLEALRADPPPLAVIEEVASQAVAAQGERTFSIVTSESGHDRVALVAADTATCDACVREILDPADRRYRYAFTNCTNCGPRFTIVRDVPYDRCHTTMVGFAMCGACTREYHDPADRRFHAQPVCCPECGPTLALRDAQGRATGGDPVEEAVRLLARGDVVAVKGLGGYHLAADAGCESAVSALRTRKHREDKPFAVMAGDLAAARLLCELGPADEGLLVSPGRPVVIAPRRPEADVAASVAPGNRSLGVMLPYTPLHHLLARALRRPFVLTSGNVSDEPIAFEDDDAHERLGHVADAFLTHDRPIHIRTDDSVTRSFRGRELLVRRSRGYAPRPFGLPFTLTRPVLGCGAELKHTFCLARDTRAFVSHHIGDLANYEAFRSFTEGVEHFRRLFGIEPAVLAHDLHPEYLSTKYAFEQKVDLVGVQHHHAHIASCLVDNAVQGPVIGIAFDGLGYGDDGTLWGGELLVADLAGYRRVGHLASVALPGGGAAIREPWRMAAAWVSAAFEGASPPGLAVAARHGPRWDEVISVATAGVASPVTSSAGRLFDAVAALVGVRDAVHYEGQAAVELEQLADPSVLDAYPVSITGGDVLRIEGADLVRAVVEDLRAGRDRSSISARFHNGLADAAVRGCAILRERTGISEVAVSGGVFQNLLLLARVSDRLSGAGFRVLVPSRVPPNDGGISLGQVAVAASRDLAGAV